MKKNISYLLFLCLFFISLTGCAGRYGTYDPESKQALRTLAGGAVGALVAGNTGGAIVGAFVTDIYNISTVKYIDKQIENGEEAARKYKDLREAERPKEEKKAEEPRQEQKKVGEIEEDKKKVETPSEEQKKVGEIEEDKKKAETPSEEQKKVETKKEEKSAKFFIEKSFVATQTVRPGATVEANVQYTLLSDEDTHEIRVTETRILSTIEKTIEIAKREIIRTRGTYISTIQFKMPDDMPRGYCVLFTTISVERRARSAKAVINVI
ncbi:MAG: hypothetical protein AB1552_06195 [Nitrospirota bacterium]